jgi:hypothetical protein
VPVVFQDSLRIDGYEVASTQIKHDGALILLLDWRATARIDKDYTVFVHLVDENGQIVASEDAQPQNGSAPTSKWKQDNLVVDPHILPIPSNVKLGGSYRLEVGLYDLPASRRLGILDATNSVITDSIIIQPFTVIE